jgi:hypothetical protein
MKLKDSIKEFLFSGGFSFKRKKSKGEGFPMLRWLVVAFLMILVVAMFMTVANPPAYFNETHKLILLLLLIIVIFFAVWLMLME